MYIVAAGTVHLLGNRISSNDGTAVELNGAGTPTIDGNLITNNTGASFVLGNVSDATISNNLVRGNGAGVSVLVPLGAAGPTIVNNTFIEKAGATSPAITSVGFDSGARIVNNIVVTASSQAAIDCPVDYEPSPPVVSFNDVVNTGGPAFGSTCAGAAGTDGNVSVDPGPRS